MRLIFEKREASQQFSHSLPGCLHAKPKLAVFLFQVCDAMPRLGRYNRGGRVRRGRWLRRGFLRAPLPRLELVRYVAKNDLELIQSPNISSFSVVRQARPPKP